jgi:hypothetical protein
MRARIEDLCSDPLFQLNLAIWLAQAKPAHPSVYPLLHEAGFLIHSIGPTLALPVDTRLRLSESSLDCQDGAKPDLVLEADNSTRLLVLECKRSSFGTSSSTASQARTLLLLSGPIVAEVLATGARGSAQGILCYLTGCDQTALLEETLSVMAQGLNDMDLETGKKGCLGIRPGATGILLEYSEELRELLGFEHEGPVSILEIQKDTDPRPLYFIPYDPNVEQSGEEKAFSRRILYERFLSYILSKAGPSRAPCEVTLTALEALIASTLGVYERWGDPEAKKHMRGLFRDFMTALRNALNEDVKRLLYHTDSGWVLKVADQASYDKLLNEISRFNPESLDLSRPVEPTLFDDVWDGEGPHA